MQEYRALLKLCQQHKASLVAVSKKQSVAKIQALYAQGQRDFAENYVQELLTKVSLLPQDIRWHFIGHLQSNKIKQILPIVSSIQSIDSLKLYTELRNKLSAQGSVRLQPLTILLQVHIAQETHKFGFSVQSLIAEFPKLSTDNLMHIGGIMGMASFTEDKQQISSEFKQLKQLFQRLRNHYHKQHPYFQTCSMGMSADYELALSEGSNMLRIGSLIFGKR